MTDTGQDKKPATPKKRTPKPPTKPPEPTTRDLLLERITHDFLYKGDLKKEVTETLKWANFQIVDFQGEIQDLFEYSEIQARLIDTDEYHAYKVSIREAHRWANTAIVNDWTPGSTFDTETAHGLEYPINEVISPEDQRLCYEVSKRCFELTILLAKYLPEGRALSLFTTEMQITRGWLLDSIILNTQ